MVKHKTVRKQLREIPLVECSPSQINQVFLNLITNAAQATEDSTGEITVATAMAANGQVRVDISDNGHGIPESIVAKIFDPFFTTKEVGKGTGLGLSQVYGFARQSGGDVHVSSTLGEGTTVTLYLPRSHADVVSPVTKGPGGEEVRGRGSVLLVEDNPQVGDVSRLLLEQLGYDITRVDRPTAALDALSKKNDFILVFSDIVMPGDMDGLALARAIQERYPKLPVLLATGYSIAAERVGAEFPILRKPYDQQMLGIAMKVALAGSGLKKATTPAVRLV